MCYFFEEEDNVQDLIDEDEVIQLINEEGEAVNFYHVATIEYKSEWFVFFQPVEDMEDISEDEVVIFKLEADEQGEELFVPIEDEALLDEVFAEYNRLMEEEGEEAEEGCDCQGKCQKDCDCKEEN